MNNQQSVKCTIFTMRKENIVLPSASVAEIISVKSVTEIEGKPSWYLGDVQWRGIDVPLISFDAAGGENISLVNLNTQAVVMHLVAEDGNQDVPYIAVVVSGVPHIAEFLSDQIRIDENDVSENPMVAEKVRINGARLSILNFDGILSMLSEAA